MRNRMIVLLFAILTAVSFSACKNASVSSAASPQAFDPPCEIKLLLDNDLVMDQDQCLLESIVQKLSLDADYEEYEAAFLDTADRAYLNAGWVNRLRKKAGKKKYTIDYKKRVSVSNSDLESALAAAEADGVSLGSGAFEAEVDWGYSQMTLSLSCDVDIKQKGKKSVPFPEDSEAVKIVKENMPAAEKTGKGVESAAGLEVVGPVKMKRYSGSEDDSIRVEIWAIPYNEETWYITEYSIECESMQEAQKRRDNVIRTLDEMGILKHEDGLKTTMILLGPDAVTKSSE